MRWGHSRGSAATESKHWILGNHTGGEYHTLGQFYTEKRPNHACQFLNSNLTHTCVSELKGVDKCLFNCSACPYVMQGRNMKINKRSTWRINRRLNCNTFNAVYMIECEKDNCKLRYIGESKRLTKYCIADHRGYIVNKHVDKATGAHFNLPGHSLSHMNFTILKQVNSEQW